MLFGNEVSERDELLVRSQFCVCIQFCLAHINLMQRSPCVYVGILREFSLVLVSGPNLLGQSIICGYRSIKMYKRGFPKRKYLAPQFE